MPIVIFKKKKHLACQRLYDSYSRLKRCSGRLQPKGTRDCWREIDMVALMMMMMVVVVVVAMMILNLDDYSNEVDDD